MGRGLLHRGHRIHRHRQGRLLPERGWHADARQEGPGTAGSEIFQADPEVTTISEGRNAQHGPESTLAGMMAAPGPRRPSGSYLISSPILSTIGLGVA